jgi:ribonucleoside-triphosphate reductase
VTRILPASRVDRIAVLGLAAFAAVFLFITIAQPIDTDARRQFSDVALSGLTPLPFFPFKALAFAMRYPLGRYLGAVALGRLPRYLLLAWLGVAVRLPPALLAALFVALLIPTLRVLVWPRRNES